MARKKIKKSTKTKVMLTISTILLVFIFFFGAYFLMTHKSDSAFVSSIYEQKLVIDKANSEAGDLIKKLDNLDLSEKDTYKGIISGIAASESKINEAFDTLDKLSSPSKYHIKYQNLLKAIELNVKLLTQTKLILKNISSSDLNSSFDALLADINSTTSTYETSIINDDEKTHFILPASVLALPDVIKQYASRAYNDLQAKNVLLEQYVQYYTDTDKLVEDLRLTKVNLNANIKLIQDGSVSIDKVYVNVDNKLLALSDIQNKYSKISVPEKVADQHQKLNDLIENYTYYCQDFKTALTGLEESLTDPSLANDIMAQFKALVTKYTDFDKSFNAFKSKYEANKMFYTDINNL